MKVVHKFRLFPGPGITELEIDGSAEVLAIQWQHTGISMWVLVDPEAPKILCTFLTLSTGRNAPDLERYMIDRINYLGTYQTPHEEVYHVFNVTGQNIHHDI